MNEWGIVSITKHGYSSTFYVATAHSGDDYLNSMYVECASPLSEEDARDRVMESMINRTPYNMLYASQ